MRPHSSIRVRLFGILLLGRLAAGCASAAKTDQAVFVDNRAPAETAAASVSIWFGTDRVAAASDQGIRFTTRQGDLTYGVCEVNIPPVHQRGNIERPSWLRLEFQEDPDKHFTLKRSTILTPSEFTSLLDSGGKGETFLFVHGFNVSFDDAAFTTAQMAYDLRLPKEPLMYSWASKADLLQYNADENSVANTRPRFKQFLKTVLSSKSITKVHLIAHSMGTRALVETLRILKEEGVGTSRIGQVVLLAADIDARYFQEQLFGKIRGIGEGFSIYSSSKDRALQASAKVAGEQPRLGQAGATLTVLEGLSTIDASFCSNDCQLCHNLSGLPCVLNDLFLSLNRKLKPEQRLMEKKWTPDKSRPYYQLLEYR